MERDNDSKGRVAVVTGANRGLGFAAVRELAGRGYRVILTARSQVKAAEAVKALAEEGLEVEPEVLDVASDASVDAFVGRLRDKHGRCDVLVNNAGTIFEPSNDPANPGGAATMHVPADIVLRAFNNNTLGAYRLIRAILPMMNEVGYGRVVNVSSGMGALSDMGSAFPAYRISKTALSAVTRLFDHEAADGVKINAVCPGWVRTDMGGQSATRSIDEGVRGIVIAATLGADGPRGKFLRDGEIIDW